MSEEGGSHFSIEEARSVGERIGIDWDASAFGVGEFRAGMNIELEHGSRDPETDVTGDDPLITGKIARAHLNEFPDYYVRLERMEADAEAGGSSDAEQHGSDIDR